MSRVCVDCAVRLFRVLLEMWQKTRLLLFGLRHQLGEIGIIHMVSLWPSEGEMQHVALAVLVVLES